MNMFAINRLNAEIVKAVGNLSRMSQAMRDVTEDSSPEAVERLQKEIGIWVSHNRNIQKSLELFVEQMAHDEEGEHARHDES